MLQKSILLAVTSAVLVSSCATYGTNTRYWTAPDSQDGERYGRVQWIRETERVSHGNPGAGAAAGALVGALLGSAFTHHGLGVLMGAAGGAAIGAESSRGSGTSTTYDVLVRFDDGGSELFSFGGFPPFRPGEAVRLTSAGLSVVASADTQPPPDAGAPPDVAPNSPEPAQPPPVASPGAGQQDQHPGAWVYTEQYGWVWMPYGNGYSYAPPDGDSDPYMYVFRPTLGWTWVIAPWLWGWGPMPHFGMHAWHRYGWYGHGWGPSWHGYRPAPYRQGFVYHGTLVGQRGGMWHHEGRRGR